MAYPKYIIDTEDGMQMKLNEDSNAYENDSEGCCLDVKYYNEGRKNGSYIKSTQRAFDKFNKDAIDEYSVGAYMKNKDWDLILSVMGKNKKTKELVALLEVTLGNRR